MSVHSDLGIPRSDGWLFNRCDRTYGFRCLEGPQTTETRFVELQGHSAHGSG